MSVEDRSEESVSQGESVVGFVSLERESISVSNDKSVSEESAVSEESVSHGGNEGFRTLECGSLFGLSSGGA
jgi:hypothetical protein